MSSCDGPSSRIGKPLHHLERYWWVVQIAYCFKKRNFVYSSSSIHTYKMRMFLLFYVMSEVDPKCRQLTENFLVLVAYKPCMCAYVCKEQMLVFPSTVPSWYSLLCCPYSHQQCIAGSNLCQPPGTFMLSRIRVMVTSTKSSGHRVWVAHQSSLRVHWVSKRAQSTGSPFCL